MLFHLNLVFFLRTCATRGNRGKEAGGREYTGCQRGRNTGTRGEKRLSRERVGVSKTNSKCFMSCPGPILLSFHNLFSTVLLSVVEAD